MSETLGIPEIVAGLRHTFLSGVSRPESWRREQLTRLRRVLVERGRDCEAALRADLGKSATEAHLTEIGFLIDEIDHALRHLSSWIRPRRARVPLALQPARAKLVPEPLGVCLVIAPWNYPLMLALSPVIGAIAAGNAVVVKPSEHAPHTAKLLHDVVIEALDRRAIACVNGGVAETTVLLAEQFDHVFYTGNGRVGRIVAQAAAAHLTPVTLELGGKSPAYVDGSVSLRAAAKRIAWGKFMNAGQTCVAPDYVLAPRDMVAPFVEALRVVINELYGIAVSRNPDYGRIVNEAQFDRLQRYLRDGTVVVGGEVDAATLFFAPTVLIDVPDDAPAMQEEIFGPVLPIRAVHDLDDAIDFVRSRPRPLSAYVFSDDDETCRRWEAETSSGALSIGVPVVHLAAPELPFGGVGASGYGAYHGEHSFTLFSHLKPVLKKPLAPETLAATIMPPFHDRRDRLVQSLLRR